MLLFNSLTRSKESFEPVTPVTLYVCGVTPYDTTHLGHARTYLLFDILGRHIAHLGARVDYVQNITDVDESILKRAAELDVSYKDLGDRYVGIYLEDVAALGLLPARQYPRATGSIEQMQELIRRLVADGIAYEVEGDVFFRVNARSSFGDLSRLSREAMLQVEATQDGSTVDDPRKEDALDFILWKRSAPGEPSWDSPWGAGRPGWHIECSTLALQFLGPQIDIHGGGSDLVYPHHECEIAQSEAVTGRKPFARFWVHVDMVRLEGEKMSKSEGNMVFVRDLLRNYSPDALRLYLLSTHYREPLDFDERGLARQKRVAETIARAAGTPVRSSSTPDAELADVISDFDRALDDDLDTPRAVRIIEDLAVSITSTGDGVAYGARRALRSLSSRLGLQLVPPPGSTSAG
jgi:L-cysteine:1D-myo-inositol 2-amino-2-deoxy-alpha-D-glucopyranoside ligase